MAQNNTYSDGRVGIGDIRLYVPSPVIDSKLVVDQRSESGSELHKNMERAKKYTGQQSIRFPAPWEDMSTLAAQSCKLLLDSNPSLELDRIRYLVNGTETSVDHSKPGAAYVQGMLQRAGYTIPESLATFQVQHACAGGTLSLISVASLLAQSPIENESGLVICSDIAKYAQATTAEITQGAGSAAMLIEKNPRLLEFDLGTIGYASRDVDDFFRPLNSETARVKGRFSIRCYREALESAFLDHCTRVDSDPAELLRGTDLFCLHVPYYSLPFEALRSLLRKYLNCSRDEAEQFLQERGFQESIAPASRIGNLYTGSMFMSLMFLLSQQYEQLGEGIVGKKILLASYGSGNTMIVVAGRVAAEAPNVIKQWDMSQIWQSAAPAQFEEYQAWLDGGYRNQKIAEYLEQNKNLIAPGAFYLGNVREDGYREYFFKE